jgi:hypothetical protein
VNSKTGKNDLINFVIIETKDDKKNIYLATVGRGLLSCSKKEEKLVLHYLIVTENYFWVFSCKELILINQLQNNNHLN